MALSLGCSPSGWADQGLGYLNSTPQGLFDLTSPWGAPIEVPPPQKIPQRVPGRDFDVWSVTKRIWTPWDVLFPAPFCTLAITNFHDTF